LPGVFARRARDFWARQLVPQNQDGGFGERPLAGGVATLAPGRAIPLASGFSGTLDQRTGSDERLPPGEAVDSVDFIAPPEGQDCADPRDGAEAGAGLGILRLGRGNDMQLERGAQPVGGAEQCEVDGEALLDGRLGKPLRPARPVRLLRKLLAELWEVGLASGSLDMGEPAGPVAHARHPAPQEVPCGAPFGGVARGLGEHAAAQQDGHRVRIAPIVLGLAAVDRLHREGVAQDEGKARLCPEVGEPGPR